MTINDYKVSAANPQHHLIDFIAEFKEIKSKETLIQLPSWRPGRYELGNFAKNIQKFTVTDDKDRVLPFEKITKDSWKVHTDGVNTIQVKYTYYGADLNAGSSFLDTEQLYLNPVNCFVYIPERIGEGLVVKFDLPDNYNIACSLRKKSGHELYATSFHELADSPLIASATLKHLQFSVSGITVNVWLQGECKPNWSTIENDFTSFTRKTMALFEDCPSTEYHYLIQILPVPFYHGVEHVNSTVLALGPGYDLMGDRYDDLLGVACHEFYHVWNIKTIRPAEMMPYDYTKENYFKTGYVAEGITTYMGDYLLWQSNVFTDEQFFREMSRQLQKHFDNYGRFNLSVADSSFDTWLDGYVPGIPDRKVSIYTEGCLLAFMADVLIMKSTHNQKSLHDVMRILYNDYFKKGKGYSAADYKKALEKVSKNDFTKYFDDLVNGTSSYETLLRKCLDYVGLDLHVTNSHFVHENDFGFKVSDTPDKSTITAIAPGSVAYASGLAINDQIVSVNGHHVRGDFAKWMNYFGAKDVKLTVSRMNTFHEIKLTPDHKGWYKNYRLRKMDSLDQEHYAAFEFWKRKS